MRTTNAVRPIRVGFVGTGYIADWHAKALGTIPAVSLSAVCDKDESRARTFGRRYGVERCYESLDAMLGDAELGLDAIHILLPPDIHARAASTSIEHGLHVFIEKPMATTATECADLIEQSRIRNVMVGVNHNFLFAPVYEDLRNDLRAGKLGQADHVVITWNRSLEQLHSGPFNLWMLRDPRNIVLEVGAHCLASMLDLVGPLEVAEVRASNPMTLPGGQTFYRRWGVGIRRRASGRDPSHVVLARFHRADHPCSWQLWRAQPSTLSGIPTCCTNTPGTGWISTAIG